jgi:MoxR-like ATPase
VVVDYPAFHEELEIVDRMTKGEEPQVAQALTLEELLELSRLADRVYIHRSCQDVCVTPELPPHVPTS